MKFSLLKLLLMSSKLMAYGLFAQILLFNMLLASDGSAQSPDNVREVRISVDYRDASLSEVFRDLEAKTDFNFVYDRKDIPRKRIGINLQNASVAEVLMEVSRQAALGFKQVNRNINVQKLTGRPDQQSVSIVVEQDISGQVTDGESGDPLPGVNVLAKGTSTGTVTDIEGKYKLSVPDDVNTLVFSSIGFSSQEVNINGRSVIDVGLTPDVQALSEVVVVGYGTQEYRDLTGSVARVDVKERENLPNTNLIQAMRGTMAGVNVVDNGRPGSSGSILVRGQNSIAANNDPLIILDGAIFSGNLADINQNDVASIDVLKDASSTAIYGARAANGVILITTKKGTTSKPTFGFNTYTGFQTYGRRPELMNGDRYAQKQIDYLNYLGEAVNPDNPSTFLQPPEIDNYNSGTTTDAWDLVKQDAPMYNAELNVSGKTDRTSYFISGAYTNQKGLIANDNFERVTSRINLENQITDWFNFGVNASFTRRDGSGIPADLTNARRLSPFGQMFNEDGTVNLLPQDDRLVPNPLMWTNIQNEDISYNLFSNVYAEIDFPFLKGLSYRINYSNQFDWGHNYRFEDDRTFNGMNNDGIGRRDESSEQYMLIENILKYEKIIADDHNIDLTLLFSNDETSTRFTRLEDRGFTNTVLSFNTVGLGSQPQISINETEFRRVSYMGRLNYKYRNKYMLTLTARQDGYSGFGENDKFGLFPSVAAGWLLSEENFMSGLDAVSFLKLRASYGRNGNQAVPPYLTLSRLDDTFYTFGSSSQVGFFASTIGNPDLGWETSTSLNLGIDFAFANDRVSGAIDYYNTQTEDLLLERSIPVMTGFESIFDNVGSTSNQGIELTLNTVNVSSGDFSWNTNFIFSRNVNEITSLYGTDADGDGVEDDDIQNSWFIGQPIDAYFDYETNGIVQEGESVLDENLFRPGFVKLVDQDGDGAITPADRTIVGQQQPDFRFGINNTITYRNFTFSMFINSMVGGQIWNPNLDFSRTFPFRANQLDLNYWTPDNPGAEFPTIAYSNPLGHRFYDDRTFVRLQDVNLTYNLPESFLSSVGISNASVYASGKNLLTFTDWNGWDPEAGNAFLVVDFPMPRIFTIGINGRF